MSSFEDKVAAATDFLRNRASLQRLTNHQEVGVVLGELLAKRGQRRISTPVRREKVKKVLAAVDEQSWDEDEVLLSATVTHFWDNEPGHSLRRRLYHYGKNHDQALEELFEIFDGPVPCEVTPESLAEDEEVEDLDEAVRASSQVDNRAGLTEDRIRAIFREELDALNSISFGRHSTPK